MKMHKRETERMITLVSQIKHEMAGIAEHLETRSTRDEIAGNLRQYDWGELAKTLATDRRRLAVELVKAYLRIWPNWHDESFGELVGGLPPLGRIVVLVCPQALADWVQIPDDAACRMRDARMPLAKFKTELWKQLFSNEDQDGKN